jgi:hypothetical protein
MSDSIVLDANSIRDLIALVKRIRSPRQAGLVMEIKRKAEEIEGHLPETGEDYQARRNDFILRARELDFVSEGVCEIDCNAAISESDGGAYVMAWVWVEKE